MANIMTEAVSTPGRDIVEQVAAKGRISGEFHGQRREGMNSTKKTARIAGVLYLVNGVTGFFSIIYVPSKLFLSGNAAATAHNILASERLFRLGIASEVICAVEYIYLLWILYRLLSGVSKTHASLMVIFGVAFVPIMCMNAVSEIAALMLLRGADFLPVFNQPQRESLAMLFLGVRRYGYDVGWIFGLWLFHFGVCVWKSGFLPRFLGALLIAACFGYLAVSLTQFLLPSYANMNAVRATARITSGGPRVGTSWLSSGQITITLNLPQLP
jgi:Domain of unknown function (DUF4386)